MSLWYNNFIIIFFIFHFIIGLLRFAFLLNVSKIFLVYKIFLKKFYFFFFFNLDEKFNMK